MALGECSPPVNLMPQVMWWQDPGICFHLPAPTHPGPCASLPPFQGCTSKSLLHHCLCLQQSVIYRNVTMRQSLPCSCTHSPCPSALHPGCRSTCPSGATLPPPEGLLESSLQCRSTAEMISAFFCLNTFLFHLLLHLIRDSRLTFIALPSVFYRCPSTVSRLVSDTWPCELSLLLGSRSMSISGHTDLLMVCCDMVLCFPAGASGIYGIIVFLTFGPLFPQIPSSWDSSYAYVGTLGTIVPRFTKTVFIFL